MRVSPSFFLRKGCSDINFLEKHQAGWNFVQIARRHCQEFGRRPSDATGRTLIFRILARCLGPMSWLKWGWRDSRSCAKNSNRLKQGFAETVRESFAFARSGAAMGCSRSVKNADNDACAMASSFALISRVGDLRGSQACSQKFHYLMAPCSG